MKRILAVAVSVGLWCSVAMAQSSEADLNARLVGKPLLLRGFWSDDKLKFDASGTPTSSYSVASFTLAGFDATEVHLQGSRLKIEGKRMALVFDKDGNISRIPIKKSKMSGGEENIKIEIDAGKGTDFGGALDAIFVEKLSDIGPTLPEYWQPYARKRFLGISDPTKTSSSEDEPTKPGADVKPPKLLKSVEPQVPNAARSAKFSGTVLIRMRVGKDGLTSHLSIAKPVGMGLDEAAIAAAAQYTFRPATRGGEPITFVLYVEVNFQFL